MSFNLVFIPPITWVFAAPVTSQHTTRITGRTEGSVSEGQDIFRWVEGPKQERMSKPYILWVIETSLVFQVGTRKHRRRHTFLLLKQTYTMTGFPKTSRPGILTEKVPYPSDTLCCWKEIVNHQLIKHDYEISRAKAESAENNTAGKSAQGNCLNHRTFTQPTFTNVTNSKSANQTEVMGFGEVSWRLCMAYTLPWTAWLTQTWLTSSCSGSSGHTG